MDSSRDLQLLLLAIRDRAVDPNRLADAAAEWSGEDGTSLISFLAARGVISPDLLQRLEATTLVNQNRGLLGYTGTLGGVPVSIQTTMMGTPTTSIVVEELLNLGCTTFIRVGTTGDYPPFSELDLSTNTYKGYEIDVATQLAADLGVKIEFVATTWDSGFRFESQIEGEVLAEFRLNNHLAPGNYMLAVAIEDKSGATVRYLEYIEGSLYFSSMWPGTVHGMFVPHVKQAISINSQIVATCDGL